MKKSQKNKRELHTESIQIAKKILHHKGFKAIETVDSSYDLKVKSKDEKNSYKVRIKFSGVKPFVSKSDGILWQWIMTEKDEAKIATDLFYLLVSSHESNILHNEGCSSLKMFVVHSHVVADYLKLEHELWLEDDGLRKDNSIRIFRLSKNVADPKLTLHNVLLSNSIEEFENKWDTFA